MPTFRPLIGAALVCACWGSHALTLGPLRGPVWLEQTLDVMVPVQLDAPLPSPLPANALCASVELSYGSMPVDRARIQLNTDAVEGADTARLRISSSAPVNDAVVSILVRVGCEQAVSRQYVALPDLSPLTQPSASARAAPVSEPPSVPLAPLGAVAGGDSQTPTTRAPSRAAPASAGKAGTTPRPARPPAAAKTPRPSSAAAAPSAPRLQLELRAPITPGSVPSPAVANAPAAVASAPASVASAPEAGASDAQAQALPDARVQQLQSDIAQLTKQAADNQAQLMALRVRTEAAEAQRSTLLTIVSVLAVLVAVLAVALPLWLRRQQANAAEDDDLETYEKTLVTDINPVDADHWHKSATPASRSTAHD